MANASTAADRQVLDAVTNASATLMGIAARSMPQAEGAVSLAQWRLLVVLRDQGGLSSGAAARALATGPSSLSRLADRLVAAGLVVRSQSPTSRRMVCLTLTTEGRRLVDSVMRRRRRELAKILSSLSEEHSAGLVEALSAFHQAALLHFEGEVPLGTL